eukprot:350235-Chlamydomonas_euryale.AAC.13
MQRPLYMRPQDALEYGIIDEIIAPNADKQQKAAEYWLRSGRAESEGRLEQWWVFCVGGVKSVLVGRLRSQQVESVGELSARGRTASWLLVCRTSKLVAVFQWS